MFADEGKNTALFVEVILVPFENRVYEQISALNTPNEVPSVYSRRRDLATPKITSLLGYNFEKYYD